jgi:hypothetical protein
MKKLLLLPITIPLGMARGAVEGALRTTADALLDLAGGGGDNGADAFAASGTGAPATPAPDRAGRQDEGGVVDLDIASAAPRRRPASRPPRPVTPVAPPAPVPPAPAPEPAATAAPDTPREVAEALGLEEGRTPQPPPELVETEGAASAGPEITVDEPWPGYGKLRAPEIVDRLRAADDATKAIVRLYEQQNRKRRTVLAATG